MKTTRKMTAARRASVDVTCPLLMIRPPLLKRKSLLTYLKLFILKGKRRKEKKEKMA